MSLPVISCQFSSLKAILVTLLLFLGWPSFSETLNFRNYTVKDGLANSTVYYIFQDSKGFIWMATETGVNRFDGTKFELFTMDNGLSDNEVLQIHEDSKGKIWFLTLNGRLSYYFKGKFYNPSNNPLLKKTITQGSYSSFFEDSSNRIWFSTNQNKLLQIDSKNNVLFYTSAQHSFVNAFLHEAPGKKLIAFTGNSFLQFKGNKFIKKTLSQYPFNSKSIAQNKQYKNLYYLSPDGLNELKKTGDTLIRKISGLSQMSVGSFILNNRKLWIGTMGKGILIFNTDSNKPENHLKNQNISHIIKDRQGNIWVSTIGNGVYMLPFYGNYTQHFTVADGLTANVITRIVKIKNQVILGYSNGNLDLIENSSIKSLAIHPKDSYNPVKGLVFQKSGNSLWYASDNSLIKLKKEGEYINYLNSATWSSYALKSFSLNNAGKIAIALASGVYILDEKIPGYNNKRGENLLKSTHFLGRAYCVFYDPAGGLWFSNIQGLHYYKSGNILALHKKYPQLKNRVTDIAMLPDNTILCSTYGFGVLLIKNKRFIRSITAEDGLSSNICKRIFIEGNNAWIVTGKGISKIDFKKPGLAVENFSADNGLLSNEINDIYVKNDTVYTASNSGLTVFKELDPTSGNTIPNVLIRSIQVNKRELPVVATERLTYKQNNITINFISLDFTHPKQLVYSYRLNSESPWTETSQQTLEFSTLEPGNYDLQIRARSMNSGWTKPVHLPISISPPFWKSWWLISSLIIFSLVVIFLAIRFYYRNKQLKEKEKLLVKTKIISLEQQALQAMMNPHFIFNVMNSIQYFINTKDHTMANQLLTGFARLIRKNLDICNKSYISIEEELSYLRLYLSLEKLRFGDKMTYTIEVKSGVDLKETYIPSMLLQPYVENAIWHGIMPMDHPGEIHVELSDTENELTLTIRDNGVGIDNSAASKNSEHISRGMNLTQQRIGLLNQFSPNSISISVSQQESGGTIVLLKIPRKPFTQ